MRIKYGVWGIYASSYEIIFVDNLNICKIHLGKCIFCIRVFIILGILYIFALRFGKLEKVGLEMVNMADIVRMQESKYELSKKQTRCNT